MESKVKVLGHPLHQMLVPFPFGLLGTAVVFDVLYLVLRNSSMVTVSYWLIIAGIIGGLMAAPFGLIDFLAIPTGTRAKSVGLVHGLGNLIVLLLFAGSWWLRASAVDNATLYLPSTVALALSFAGFALAGLTGWLGGELVDRHGVGVDTGAHLDAPSSLSGRPASEKA